MQEIIKYDNIGLQQNNVHTKLRADGSGVEMDSHKEMTWYFKKHSFSLLRKGSWLQNASKKISDPTALLDIVRICWKCGAEGNKTHTRVCMNNSCCGII